MSEFQVAYREEAIETPSLLPMVCDLIVAAREKAPAMEIRGRIEALEAQLEKLPQVEQPVDHFFTDGLYGRRIFNPQDSFIVTKIHKKPNFSFLLSGKLSVITEHGLEIVEGPRFFVTEPGTKRVLYAQTDVVFMTVHANRDNCEDLDTLEARIIAKSFNELGSDACGVLQ